MKDDRTPDLFAAREQVAELAEAEGEGTFARQVRAGAWDHRSDVQAAARGEPLREAHARNTDPDTSHEAAESISPRLRELQRKVLMFAYDYPDGFIDPELNRRFDTHGSTYRTRRAELVEQGLIRDSGERRTDGGTRRHIIWQITLEGINRAQEA